MKKYASILIILTCLTLTGAAEAPMAAVTQAPTAPTAPTTPENTAKIVLTAPTTAQIGELITLDASASAAAAFKWLSSTPDFMVIDSGKRAVFSARKAGVYQFTLAVALRDTIDVQTFAIKVDGPAQPPTDDSLESWIPYWRAEMTLEPAALEALAVSFEQVSLQMETLVTPAKIIQATAEANRAALGASLPQFVPLLQRVQASLDKLAKSGQLKTPAQHSLVWQAIARGLRK
jgi:hypothetical protein